MKTTPRELRNLNTNSAFLHELKQSLSLSEIQRKVLLGSLMGDGCLIENSSQSNYRFQVEHCDKQKAYVFWKYEIFKNFVLTPPTFRPDTKSWKFRTFSHNEFSRYHRVFYHERRKMLPESLEFLADPLICAVWFMDDGGSSRSGCLINTQNFTDGEVMRLKNFFQSEIDIPSILQRNKGRFRLYIPAAYLVKWRNFLGSNIREEFEYKLERRRPVETSPIKVRSEG